jgi:hypothetical protein
MQAREARRLRVAAAGREGEGGSGTFGSECIAVIPLRCDTPPVTNLEGGRERGFRHLLHVGFPKAGSTALQRWFETHPQLCFSDGHLAGFRTVHELARGAAFPTAGDRFHVTSCEGFTAPRPAVGLQGVEYHSVDAPLMAERQARVRDLLRSMFADAVILIVTRGFRSMILSSYSQYVRSGGHVELAAMIGEGGSRTGDDPHDHDPWHYDFVIELYRDAFGTENVIVMPWELLRDDAEAFVRVIEARLSIDHVPMSRDRVNESLSPVELAWYPRLTRLARRARSKRLERTATNAMFTNRLRLPIRILQRMFPVTPVTSASLPDAVVETFRGRAETLRGNPLYEPYYADYLL